MALLGIAIGAVVVMGGVYVVARRVPKVRALFVKMKEKLVYGAFLTYYVKSFLKMYVGAF